MKTLITKVLTPAQIELLNENKIDYDCVPFMSYQLDFNLNELKTLLEIENATWIFTSKRAVDSIATILKDAPPPDRIITVGKNAAHHLNQLGFDVEYIANTSDEIVAYLKNVTIVQVIYFRGRYYRNTIPAFCKKNNIKYKDTECYYAVKNEFKIELSNYHSMWVFSPINAQIAAGIKGINFDIPVFSIGPVTSKSLSNAGFTKIKAPEMPSFENVLNLFLDFAGFKNLQNLKG